MVLSGYSHLSFSFMIIDHNPTIDDIPTVPPRIENNRRTSNAHENSRLQTLENQTKTFAGKSHQKMQNDRLGKWAPRIFRDGAIMNRGQLTFYLRTTGV